MKLNIKEKKALYVFGCPSHKNTVPRFKLLVSLTVDPEAKHWLLGLTRKIEQEAGEEWFPDFYRHLRMEMDGYFRCKRCLRVVEASTDYEEGMYEEAV